MAADAAKSQHALPNQTRLQSEKACSHVSIDMLHEAKAQADGCAASVLLCTAGALLDKHCRGESLECGAVDALGQRIRQLLLSSDEHELDGASVDVVADVVVANLDVLGP